MDIDRIRLTEGLDPLALVFFTDETTNPSTDSRHDHEDIELVKQFHSPIMNSYTAIASNTFNSAPLRYIDLSSFMDNTPLGVSLKLPVELVIDLFTKLGPRYILVKENGNLMGLITKKDILGFLSKQEKE